MRDVWVRKTNTKNNLTKYALAAAIVVMAGGVGAQPVQALSLRPFDLVHDTTSDLGNWLQPNGRSAPATVAPGSSGQTASPQPQPAPSRTVSSPPSPQTASTTSRYYGEPLTVQAPPRIDLNAYKTSTPRHADVLTAVASSYITPLASTNAATVLQPTGRGWRIGGVLWYWWALAGAVAALGYRLLRRDRRWPFESGVVSKLSAWYNRAN